MKYAIMQEYVGYPHSNWSEENELYFPTNAEAEQKANELNDLWVSQLHYRYHGEGPYFIMSCGIDQDIDDQTEGRQQYIFEEDQWYYDSMHGWVSTSSSQIKCTCGAAALGYLNTNLKAHSTWCEVHDKKRT
jgi:hypothetical protein